MEYVFTFSIIEILVLSLFIAAVYMSGWSSGKVNALVDSEFSDDLKHKNIVELSIVVGADEKVRAYEIKTGNHLLTVDKLDDLQPALMELVKKNPKLAYWYSSIAKGDSSK